MLGHEPSNLKAGLKTKASIEDIKVQVIGAWIEQIGQVQGALCREYKEDQNRTWRKQRKTPLTPGTIGPDKSQQKDCKCPKSKKRKQRGGTQDPILATWDLKRRRGEQRKQGPISQFASARQTPDEERCGTRDSKRKIRVHEVDLRGGDPTER